MTHYRRLGGLPVVRSRADLTHYAKIIVSRFERINELSCIMHGDDRDSGTMMSGRFQVFEEHVDKYRRYLDS
jgi:hypothetical protein